MSDDSRHENREPVADRPEQSNQPPQQPEQPNQPPEVPAEQSPAAPPTWAPPTYGGPPANWAAPGTPYGSTSYGSAPYGSAPYGNPYGPTGNTDYLQSPSPSRRHRVLIGVVVVLVVAAGITATVVGVGSGKTKTSAASSPTTPSAAAVVPSAPAPSSQPDPSSQPAPSGGAPPQASSGPLDHYLVAPSDLGAHTLMVLIDGGRDVTDEATLDFCGYHYTSESLRSARVQVEYIGGSQDASNEFVRYKPGGVTSAYSEIQKAVDGCPSTYSDTDSQMSHIQHLANLSGLVKEHVAIEFAVTTTSFDGSPINEWSTVVYQFDGDYFSGIYVYGTDKTRVAQVGAQLAEKAAQHLIEAATGKPGTGGGTFTDPNAQLGPGAQA